MLKFSYQNQKINLLAKYLGLKKKEVLSFDVPAGWTCPKADICKSMANKETGKIKRTGKFLCFASKGEAYAPAARRLRWHNLLEINACRSGGDHAKIVELIQSSMPKEIKILRIHSSGDFYCEEYFKAWVEIAKNNPHITFFGYTKELDYVLFEKPSNFVLQYSWGGKDDLRLLEIKEHIPTCYVAEYDNQYPNLPVVCGTHETAHEDYLHIMAKKTFVIAKH